MIKAITIHINRCSRTKQRKFIIWLVFALRVHPVTRILLNPRIFLFVSVIIIIILALLILITIVIECFLLLDFTKRQLSNNLLFLFDCLEVLLVYLQSQWLVIAEATQVKLVQRLLIKREQFAIKIIDGAHRLYLLICKAVFGSLRLFGGKNWIGARRLDLLILAIHHLRVVQIITHWYVFPSIRDLIVLLFINILNVSILVAI